MLREEGQEVSPSVEVEVKKADPSRMQLVTSMESSDGASNDLRPPMDVDLENEWTRRPFVFVYSFCYCIPDFSVEELLLFRLRSTESKRRTIEN